MYFKEKKLTTQFEGHSTGIKIKKKHFLGLGRGNTGSC